MIFGRKHSRDDSAPAQRDSAAGDELGLDHGEDLDPREDDRAEDLLVEDGDWRADGPFDFEEVDLHDDEVARIDLGTLIVTPWDGMGLQLQVDEQTREVMAVTGVWNDSGLELVLFAAPHSGGLDADLREEARDEAAEAGGTVEIVQGPFGPEMRRVLPHEGPEGEQLFHVSRVWFAQGPRWLLRGTLLGEAALHADDPAMTAPFLEFFRNLVVRRGSQPRVPGERITMNLPEGAS